MQTNNYSNISINITQNQLIEILKQLDEKERTSILLEFKDELFRYVFQIPLKKMTIDEYNAKLEEGLKSIENGNTIEHNELKKQMETWMNEQEK